MRQGQFGKLYAGYGYDADTKTEAKNKYVVGGNANIFSGSSRVSVIGLFNNINQQNFSFEDILGVSGGSGRGRRGGVGPVYGAPPKRRGVGERHRRKLLRYVGQARSGVVSGQLFLQQHRHEKPFDDRQMVRVADARGYALDARLLGYRVV